MPPPALEFPMLLCYYIADHFLKCHPNGPFLKQNNTNMRASLFYISQGSCKVIFLKKAAGGFQAPISQRNNHLSYYFQKMYRIKNKIAVHFFNLIKSDKNKKCKSFPVFKAKRLWCSFCKRYSQAGHQPPTPPHPTPRSRAPGGLPAHTKRQKTF